MTSGQTGPDFEGHLRALARVWLAGAVRHRGNVLFASVALVFLSLLLAAWRLELRTSNLDLVDGEVPEVASFLDFAERFGTPNALVLVLEGADPEQLEERVVELGAPLRALPTVRNVVDRLSYDPETLALNGLDPFLTSYDRRQYFLFVQPVDPRSDVVALARFVDQVEGVVDSTADGSPVHVGYTGIPRYALDDRDVIRRDIAGLSGVSAVLVFAVLGVGLGTLRWSLALMGALLVGVAATVGVAALLPGHLTLLSAFFGSILFGLGVDFGIHALSRYREECRRGAPHEEALVQALSALAPALLAAAGTTAAVFVAMTWSGFKGFAELGWIAGVGVLLCFLASYTVLPAIASLLPKEPRTSVARPLGLGGPALRRVSAVAATLLLVLAGYGALLGSAPFDSDYLNLQPADSEAVRLERAMVEGSDLSPLFAAFVRPTLEAAAELTDRLLDDPLVGDARSAADVVDLFDEDGRALELPEEWRSSFVHRSANGTEYAVYAYPAVDAWSVEGSSAFVRRMREIDPQVTGMPILGQRMVELTLRAKDRTLLSGWLVLGLCLLLAFRDLGRALLASVPTLLTVVSLQAAMAGLGLTWNPISVMALPIVLGIAIDDGIHLVHRFAERQDLGDTLRGAGRSVTLTSLTTLAAFGPLTLASHRGLASFASILVLGILLALAHSLIVLPFLLGGAAERGWIRAYA